MEMNGGSVIAMTGKNCVAIASDLRLGQQAVGLTADFEKVSPGSVDRASVVGGRWSVVRVESGCRESRSGLGVWDRGSSR